ncbi:cation diffusion facilitator family transporter [Pelagovum pacificum]|uniref:Cation transporter n=1 Tax=Pelagovum pacificum TaxID=2588711 RepID=A0A5C5GIQ4_9RHOB|nr:cation diffusion facilitator family transporter [Pelagovum pacificum]QQA42824.1 cation transporter [Pelagovum pacificum]TNY34027.1 cation transporter [Pelagovum pacificum]
MPHDHSHHHHHHEVPEGDGRLALAVAGNLGLTVAQIVGGIFSGSLALIADALHNLSDAMALVIAFAARKIARRPADKDMTFGYARAETVAALINYTTLIVLGLYLAYEAVMRFFSPEPVAGWAVVIIAGIALVIDLATAALTYAMSKSSQNIRAAFLHNVADAAGSVAVILSGTLIIMFGWMWIDPVITLLISAYILWMSFSEIGEVIRVLMLGKPTGIDTGKVIAEIAGVSGVRDVHHVHLWQVEERLAGFEAHVVIANGRWADADAIKSKIKSRLHDRFGIEHSTLELECAVHACSGAPVLGHA